MSKPQFTILNGMAGPDFEAALDRHAAWGLKVLDLKDQLYGKDVSDLTTFDTFRIEKAVTQRKMSIHCLSTGLFHADVELGERHFHEEYIQRLGLNVLPVAMHLKVPYVRLLAPKTKRRKEFSNINEYLESQHPWVYKLFRFAVDLVDKTGGKLVIENEAHENIFSNTAEIVEFFQRLERPGKVFFTWDVQNLWQMGTYPNLSVYRELKPLIAYYHIKGGRSEDGGAGPLVFASSIEDASWPVLDITKQVIADGVSPVICLNPSHGAKKDRYDYSNITERDVKYVQRVFGG